MPFMPKSKRGAEADTVSVSPLQSAMTGYSRGVPKGACAAPDHTGGEARRMAALSKLTLVRVVNRPSINKAWCDLRALSLVLGC